MLKSFRLGGIHPSDNKLSAMAVIEQLGLPSVVTIPLSQHIGAPAIAIVSKGDTVVVGQLIAKAGGFVSSNIHSSVSGKVTAVDTFIDASGVRKSGITIKVEGDEWLESIDRTSDIKDICELNAAEIIQKIADAGIVGLGGATFPTQVKLMVPKGKVAEFLVINGVECEPYLTADHRLMLEMGEQLIIGVRLLAKALGAEYSYIGIENNKPDAIKYLNDIASRYLDVEIVPLKVQYPQGGEKQLIAAITKREIPSGKLPIDVGVVVQNVGTAFAVYEAVQKNKPLIERVITVTGKQLEKTANLLVRVGTPIEALIAYCGGLPKDTGKVIGGGPMMGRAISNLAAPVTKGTSGVLLMSRKESLREKASTCIKCGKCVSVCPMGLEPYLISKLSKLGRLAETEEYYVADCIECGSCSYVCPASLPILDMVRLGKVEVMKIIRNRKS